MLELLRADPTPSCLHHHTHSHPPPLPEIHLLRRKPPTYFDRFLHILKYWQLERLAVASPSASSGKAQSQV